MKKLLLLILILGTVNIYSFSQPKQGAISVGGTFGIDFGSSKTETNNNTDPGPDSVYFAFIPSVEYFITDRFSAGIGIGYSVARSKDEAANVTYINSTRTFIMNPYVRMYFSMGERASLFGQGSIFLGLGKDVGKTKDNNGTYTTKLDNNLFRMGIQPGVSLFLTDKLALEATFGFVGYQYHQRESSPNTTRKNSHVIFDVSPRSIGFGLRYFIR